MMNDVQSQWYPHDGRQERCNVTGCDEHAVALKRVTLCADSGGGQVLVDLCTEHAG